MRSRLRRTKRPGLSLIEVLLSLAIFIMSIVVISRLIDMGTDRGADARMFNTASRLAQAKLAEFEMGVTSFNETSGSFTDGDADWQWTATPEQWSPTLYNVTVTVSRTTGGRPFELSVGQMMLDPSVKGAAVEATRPDPSSQ